MRNDLKSPTGPGANPGLALDRFVPWPKKDDERHEFYQGVVTAKHDPAYVAAFDRWKTLVTERKVLVCCATLGGPLAVGLGNASPSEVGLTLHRIYGMPLIPGSAVKGACKRAVLAGQAAVALDTLFGTVKGARNATKDAAGYATFHDAWYVPGSVGGAPLQVDTVTVHHPLYYQNDSKDRSFPTDFDDPTPVPFVSVKPGAQFLFAVEVPVGWEEFAEKMLHHALTQIGLGGKTNAGYGWFKPWLAGPTPPPPPVDEEVWESCELERRDEPGNRWSIRIRSGEKRASISQGDWTKLPGRPAPLNKGKRRTATVRLQRNGNNWKVIEVKLL